MSQLPFLLSLCNFRDIELKFCIFAPCLGASYMAGICLIQISTLCIRPLPYNLPGFGGAPAFPVHSPATIQPSCFWWCPCPPCAFTRYHTTYLVLVVPLPSLYIHPLPYSLPAFGGAPALPVHSPATIQPSWFWWCSCPPCAFTRYHTAFLVLVVPLPSLCIHPLPCSLPGFGGAPALPVHSPATIQPSWFWWCPFPPCSFTRYHTVFLVLVVPLPILCVHPLPYSLLGFGGAPALPLPPRFWWHSLVLVRKNTEYKFIIAKIT